MLQSLEKHSTSFSLHDWPQETDLNSRVKHIHVWPRVGAIRNVTIPHSNREGSEEETNRIHPCGSSSSSWFSTFERSPVRNSLSSLAAWSMGGDGWWCPWWHVVLEKMMIRNWEVTGAWHGGSLRCQFWRLPEVVCLDLVNGFSVQRRSSSSSIVVSVWPRDGMCWRRVCS